jgi:hypothetical protein
MHREHADALSMRRQHSDATELIGSIPTRLRASRSADALACVGSTPTRPHAQGVPHAQGAPYVQGALPACVACCMRKARRMRNGAPPMRTHDAHS